MDFALFTQEGLVMILRWIHFFAGIIWIGLLYYFNFVQGEFFKETDGTTKNNAVAKLVPRALWWFRWGAMFTFLSGLFMLAIAGHDLKGDFFQTSYGIYITAGALLGTLMFLNVWLIIWPNQKIVIASTEAVLKGGQANPAAAGAAAKAGLASRTNVLFSMPMMFFMGASRHLSLNIPEGFNPCTVLIALAVIIGALELNGIKGKMGPMTTIKGVVHCGLALLVVLYVMIEVIV
ncbi:MAG: urate hydroxylase PuuD [Bacteriovoracaceae bacterium]|nr:urate hydroxylase PuuD [Bacteriovoracaceae bacterium]